MISWVKSEEIISMGDQLFDKVKPIIINGQQLIVAVKDITCVITSLCQKNKSWNFASIFWGHFKVGIETPQNNFQIYRPINDPRRAVCSLAGDIGRGLSNKLQKLEDALVEQKLTTAKCAKL